MMYDNVLVFGLSVIQNNNHSYGGQKVNQTNTAIDLTSTIVVQQTNTLNNINIYY